VRTVFKDSFLFLTLRALVCSGDLYEPVKNVGRTCGRINSKFERFRKAWKELHFLKQYKFAFFVVYSKSCFLNHNKDARTRMTTKEFHDGNIEAIKQHS